MNNSAYWIAVRGIAKKALYAFGTGPLYDFVHGTVTRSPEHGEKVRAYLREQVEYSSWVVSHRVVLESMQEDVRQQADLLLKANAPTYYRLRFGGVRFVVAPDFDDTDSDDYETPMRWNHPDEIGTAMVKLENQYKQAKLSLPTIEIVAFNKEHQEIPK